MAQPPKDVNIVDFGDADHEGGSGLATPLAHPTNNGRPSKQSESPVSPKSRGPDGRSSSQLNLGREPPFGVNQNEETIGFSGPTSPSGSSSTSFVFPVRSVFANRNQPQNGRKVRNEPVHNAQQQTQYQAPSNDGGLPRPQDPNDPTGRDRSPSLPAGTAGSSISSILAQGESIQNMLEGHTYDLAEIHKHLPWAHLSNENSEAGPSNGYRPPGVVGSGFYSAPLPTVAETAQSTYFIDALLNEERRKSDGTDMLSGNSSSPTSRSTSNLPVPNTQGGSSGDRSQSQMHRTSSRDSRDSRGRGHAYGQIDPAPKDAPSPGQTTERSNKSNDSEDGKTYSFSHHPRKNEKINISGPSDGKRIRNSRNASNRPMPEDYDSDEANEADDSDNLDDDDHGPRPVMLGDNFQSNGLGDNGERMSEDSAGSGSRTDTIHPIRRQHENKEPDVGPGTRSDSGRSEVIDQDESPTEDKKQEEGGLAGVTRPSSTQPQTGSPRNTRPSSTTASHDSDMRPFESGITLLPGRAGEEGNTESSYGTRTSSLRGSKDALHSAMRGGKKQNKAQVNSMPDYHSSVQNFVNRQAETTNLSDPNAPTPSPGPGDEAACGRESARDSARNSAVEEDEDDMMMDAESAAAQSSLDRSASEVSRPGEEPLMTVRFEHVTTDDGHHVVTGREGQLKKCEDEPITTPGSVQSFGVLMVLEENFETDELVVRQVSENSTDILGLSPKYLFKVSCFTRNLSRHQEHVLRDNIDYLPDPDMDEDTLTDEGPHVFLLSGFGEPGTGDRDVSDNLSNGSSVTDSRRKEWTCWVAAHRPAQTAAKKRGTGAANQEAEPRNLIILEFELEKDFQNPLYPPVTRNVASGVSSPTTGSNTSTTTGSRTSMNTAPSADTVKGRDGGSEKSSRNLRPSVVMTPRTNSQDSGLSDSTLQVRNQEEEVMGLDGDEMDVKAEDILESTTSHAKPLRALERLRRMTRNQTQTIEDGSQSSQGKGARPRPNRRGTGSGGVGTMDVFAVLAQINDQLSQAPDLDSFLKIVVGVIKDLTQFHRCLVYSFDSAWNGLVVAELVDWSKTHDLYKGLQFPATDIPAQARELYRINKVRLLYDRTHTTARMVLRSQRDLDNPVDMTHCYLRAMSPIHMVYLKNMGVRSSMSISIMAFGSLWGLIACHGYGNHGLRVSFPVRQMLRLLSDSVSRNIERLSYAARLHTRKLISTIPTDAHPTGYIVSNANDLLALFDADCGVLVIGEGAKILGSSTEHGQEILLIAEYLRYKKFNQMQISSHIGEDFPDLVSSRNLQIISGLLYVPLSTGGQDFIAFLRKGQSRQVHWAGKPYKDGKEKGANLEPRQSFKVWSETIAGKSKNWTDEQLETAGVLALVYGKFIEVWRQKESALKANQMTSLLLSNATHEVRTPLNQIINYLELALDGQLDGETRENLTRSHTASKSLLFTINDLLDLTRIESGNETAFNDPFDIRQCIKDASRMYASEAKRRGLEYNIDLHAAPDSFLLGDQKKIRTVVANLIANAVKYTETGSVSVSCRAKSSDEESAPSADSGFVQTEIIVADTGCGIPSDKLQAMFVTLEQADSGEDQSVTGLGLGLAVVARIIEQVGGTLRADSEVGKGSKFYFNVTMARHEGTATASDNSLVNPPARSGSVGSGSGSAISSARSTGTRELDGFVDAFSQSHMARAGPDDERIRSAEARMAQPGTFPVADSSWPIKPAKTNDDKQSSKEMVRPNYSRSQSAFAHHPSRSPPLRITTSAGDPSISSGPYSPSETAQTDDTLETRATDDSKPKKKRAKPIGGKLRILIVEDDDVNRKILERRLKMDGHEVISDTNGQEAVDRIREDPNFDCILMDIQMPVMDGRESAATIRKCEPSVDSISPTLKRVDGRIPILAVSATLLEADRSKLAKDFDGWILKPIDFKRMLRLLSGISIAEHRVEDAYVRGQWERGGWFNSLKNARRKSSRQ